jgi:hypothetical protein
MGLTWLKIIVAVFIPLGSVCVATAEQAVTEKALIPVLCLASEDTAIQGLNSIEPKALAAYRKLGYELHFGTYQKTDRATLFKYQIVVGMMPQLYCGTRAIDARLEADLNAYMQAGGGVIMIPAPSYYGVEDFVKQLNPWLGPHGAALLSEIPLDPANQKEIVRILAYRYLRTANLKKEHPVTNGIDYIWLPLDFSNHFMVTYSMTLSPEWEILIRGEKSCATYPFNKINKNIYETGTWKSEPPFLAVRQVGKGRLALFTTASGYFIYDAFHWSLADGFVLTEGNGLKLMDNLFRYVSANPLEVTGKIAPVRKQITATGNIPVSPDKDKWLEYVMRKFMPAGSGVKYYIDCGAVADIPFSPERGCGYINTAGTNWLIRWAWSEIFHATAANCRATDIKNFDYRFDHLDPQKQYQLGVLVWAYQKEGARELEISADGKIMAKILPPRFDERQGPLFSVIDIPATAITGNTLLINFGRGTRGDGTFTSICELWLFEKNIQPMTPEQITAQFEPPAAGSCEQLAESEYFPGLIGARSNYTDGKNTVAEMANAAKNANLRFLIFTDELKQLTPEKLAKLQKDCKAASGPAFSAIPGLQLSASYTGRKRQIDDPKTYGPVNAYFFGKITQLPDLTELASPYQLFWRFLGGEYCGGDGIHANLLSPGKNGISPFYQRFWRGFNLITFDSDKIVDDSRNTYTDLLASGYGPYPRVSGNYRSSDEIVCAANGWKTTILARNQEDMPPYQYSSSVSSGPEIRRLAFSCDYMRDGENGGGILFSRRVWLQAHLSVRHVQPIAEVVLYRGTQPIRHWYPDRRFVKIDEPVLITEQCELSWLIRGTDGTEARSGRFQCQDSAFLAGMCSDNQNSICSVTMTPTGFERDDRELYLQHSYWHTGESAGQLGVMRDARELVPRVIESGIIQLCKYLHPGPELVMTDGSVENHINAEMRIKSASRAFNLIRYDFNAPGAAMHSRTDITAFRPANDGATAILLENSITAQRDLSVAEWRRMYLLKMGMMPSLPRLWQYTAMTAPEKLTTGKFADIAAGQEMLLPLTAGKNGLMLWPNDLASLAVFPLDNNTYQTWLDNVAKAWNVRERFRIGMEGRDIKKGEIIQTRFLVMLYPRAINRPEDLNTLRNLYVERSGMVSNVTTGAVQSTDYVIRLKADNGTAVFDAAVPSGTDPLPLLLDGMNPRWSCGLWQNGRMQTFSSLEQKMYALIKPGFSGKVAAGHPLTSSNPELVIEWEGIWQGGVRARLHNPLPREMEFEIRTSPFMPDMPDYQAKIKLSPGESIWLWGSKQVTVIEKPDFIVNKVEKTDSGINIKISNGKDFLCEQGKNVIINRSKP